MIEGCVIGVGQAEGDGSEEGVFAHHLMRASLEAFQCRFDQLSPDQKSLAETTARKSMSLETAILSSPEAWDIFLPESVIHESVEAVRARYESHADFEQDLAENGLDEQALTLALARELWVDAVLARVAKDVSVPTDGDARRWYDSHPERFLVPEMRTARHILITVNEDFADNVRGKARLKIEAIRDQLDGSLAQFERFAQQHSECPTALDGGLLGTVPQGKLYSMLDMTLFAMEEGAISSVLESEIGFHILLCESIHEGRAIAFDTAKQRIIDHLNAKNRYAAQRQWISGLGEGKQAAVLNGGRA